MSPTNLPNLPELQAEHARLVESSGGDVLAHITSIRAFVEKVVTAGAGLNAREDRTAAQGLINFWTARVSASARSVATEGRRGAPGPSFDETLLADFDTGVLARAVDNAEEWLKEPTTPGADVAVARKIILRLVRLNSADRPEAVTLPRDQLVDILPQDRVSPVLDRLIALSVIRADTENGRPTVALRSNTFLTDWPWLRELVRRRTEFRVKARAWTPPADPPLPTEFPARLVAAGVAALNTVGGWLNAALVRLSNRARGGGVEVFSEAELVEAEDYRDRTDVELRVIYRSQQQEKANVARDRVQKGLLAGLAVVLAAMTAAAVVGYWWAIESAGVAKREERKAKEATQAVVADSIAASTSTMALTSMWVTEDADAIHLAKKLLLLQTLRQVLFARDDVSLAAARVNWNRLESELCDRDPSEWHRKWFDMYLRKDHGDKVKLILNGSADDRAAVDALRWCSRDLKKYFEGNEIARAAITTVSRSVLNDSATVTKSIAAAAEAGRTPDDCWPERRSFWRLDCVGLVLATPDHSPADEAVREYSDALKGWEDEGVKASPDQVKRLRSAADRLLQAVAELNSRADDSNDFYQLRINEQKPNSVPRK